MDPESILEPIFTNFILKIELLKQILYIIKPKYGVFRLNQLLNDRKIDNIFMNDASKNTQSFIDDSNVITSIKLKQSSIFSTIFTSLSQNYQLEDELLQYAYGYHTDILSEEAYNILYEKLLNIEKKYNNKISILVSQHKTDNNACVKKIVMGEYNKYLLNSRMPSRMHEIFSSIMNFLDDITENNTTQSIQIGDINYENIKILIRSYNTYNIDTKLEKIDRESCDICNIRYTVDHEKGEIFCKSCGLLSKISNDMYGGAFSLSTEVRSKNSMYVSSGHCEFWFKRIFALEPTDMEEKVILSVKNWLIKNNYPITCEYIRKSLQKLKLPTYNTHVSLIRKLLTGKVPEPPSYKIKTTIFNDFNLAVQIYSEIYQDNNIKYYPYFIWKIIEMIYEHQKSRRYEIFECIHLQNLDTLKKNDKIWKRICDKVPRFKFKPTDRNEQYIHVD